MYASANGHLEIVKGLIERGADTNLKTYEERITNMEKLHLWYHVRKVL